MRPSRQFLQSVLVQQKEIRTLNNRHNKKRKTEINDSKVEKPLVIAAHLPLPITFHDNLPVL